MKKFIVPIIAFIVGAVTMVTMQAQAMTTTTYDVKSVDFTSQGQLVGTNADGSTVNLTTGETISTPKSEDGAPVEEEPAPATPQNPAPAPSCAQ